MTANPALIRRAQRVLWLLAAGITVLGAIMVLGAYRNDRAIDGDRGVAEADVLSASETKAQAAFYTEDGTYVTPKRGLLYPSGLHRGDRIQVEYQRSNPALARPLGRDWTVSLRPALSVVGLTWLVCGGLIVGGGVAARRLERP